MSYKGKRAFNLAVAVPALAVAAPIILVAAFARAAIDPVKPTSAIALKDRFIKNLFFTQERIGEDGVIFRIHKIKTMRNATHPGEDVDSRIGPIGRVLRKTKLDELPQFFNVITGDMSIVGPRPLTPKDPENKLIQRSFSKPGIFSTATALGVRNIKTDNQDDQDDHTIEILALDWQDAANPSLINDLKIIGLHAPNAWKIFHAPDHRTL